MRLALTSRPDLVTGLRMDERVARHGALFLSQEDAVGGPWKDSSYCKIVTHPSGKVAIVHSAAGPQQEYFSIPANCLRSNQTPAQRDRG